MSDWILDIDGTRPSLAKLVMLGARALSGYQGISGSEYEPLLEWLLSDLSGISKFRNL